MTRFAFSICLLLLLAGCRTAAHNPQKTILVHNQNAAHPFWNRTAQFFQPLMPDIDRQTPEIEHPAASSRFPSDILTVNYTPYPLYKPGSIFLSPVFSLQKPEENLFSIAAMANVAEVHSPNINPLQIQAGDSEAFRGLLREITNVSTEQRKVDETKLSEMLTSFRNDVKDGIVDADFEGEYLDLLRRRILPETAMRATATARSAAPLPVPEAELATTRHPLNSPGRQRQFDRQNEWGTHDDDLYEPVIARNTMAMARPVYPDLVQIPPALHGVAQMSYQTQVLHTPPLSGFGAGDWQTPVRAAVEQLRYAIEQTPNGRSVSNEMRLRLLETILGNKTEASRPMPSADEIMNSFMGNQVLGLAALLDDTTQESRSKHIAAAFRFNEGLMDLQSLCPIRLKNVTFVKECYGYGQFVPHPNEFHPGDKFHVYMDIENPTVHRSDMYETCWAYSYEIRDERANRIVKHEGGQPAGENSLNRKRDYFFVLPGVIPASTPPGHYQLLINITDLNDKSRQFAVERLDFRVVPAMGREL